MAITRREAKEIVDWVISEIMKRRFPYITDGKLDFSKPSVGTISGTQTSGGQIANGAIWDRHVHPDADIRGTKIRIATTAERGTVKLGTEGEALVPTMSGLSSLAHGLGASLIGIEDADDDFVSTDVEAALHELLTVIGALTFLDLSDTPNTYSAKHAQVATVTEDETALEFKPVDYIEGGHFTSDYTGALPLERAEVDAETFNEKTILDGGGLA